MVANDVSSSSGCPVRTTWRLRLFLALAFAGLLAGRAWAAGPSNWQTPAGNWSDATNWTAGEPGTSTVAGINNGGTATVNSNGELCQYLQVGYNAGSTGTLEMTAGTLTDQFAYVGYYGAGSMVQSGGTHTITSELYLAREAGSTGTYTLSGNALLTSEGDQYIGYQGTAVFNQTGGFNSVQDWWLHIGNGMGSSGTYNLSGGQLASSMAFVGELGAGTVNQSGGTATFSEDLYLGRNDQSVGAYNLSGTGQLTAGYESVGSTATNGTFTQTGGKNTVTSKLTVRSTYRLNGGTLDVKGAIDGFGTLILDGGTLSVATTLNTGTLHVGYDAAASYTHATAKPTDYNVLYVGTRAGSSGTYNLTGTGGSTSVCDAQYVGAAGTGVFNHSGGEVLVGALVLGDSATGNGTYYLSGTADLTNYGWFHIGGAGTGAVEQTGGTATISGGQFHVAEAPGSHGAYDLQDGTLTNFEYSYIGYGGTGTFNQSGGTHSVSDYLYLGYLPGSTGTYTLNGTGLLTPYSDQYIGYQGTGIFEHSAGINQPAPYHDMSVGKMAGGDGTYRLSGTGQFGIDNLTVGDAGKGAFEQSGGTANSTGYLVVGSKEGSEGSYSLTGGTLTVASGSTVGGAGNGRFLHFAGTHTVSSSYGSLTIGSSATGEGFYDMGGTAQLNVDDLNVGWYGNGRMNQAGGVVNLTGNLYVGYDDAVAGAYSLSDTGQLSAKYQYVGSNGTGSFHQSGGTNTVAGDLSLAVGDGSSGSYILDGGTLTMTKMSSARNLYVGTNGTATFSMGNAAGTGAISETGTGTGINLVIRRVAEAPASFLGWGRVGLTGKLTNNGRVAAFGYGTDRDLDMTSFASADNVYDNATTNGWFAGHHGRLLLPAVAVAAATGSRDYNWGEASYDSTPDLVNSARLTLTNVTVGGALAGTLLAPDRLDVPTDTVGQIVGLWDFTPPAGFAMASTTAKFRYDDAMAAALGLSESGLRLYRFAGGQWNDVTASVDTTAKTATSASVTGLGTFALGNGIAVPGNKWGPDGGGSINNPGNWTSGTAPDGSGVAANFLSGRTGPVTVTVDTPIALGAIHFRSVPGVTIDGPGSITLGTAGSPARIDLLDGDHQIAAPIIVDANTFADLGYNVLSLTGGLNNAGGRTITRSGEGTLTVSGPQVHGPGAIFNLPGGRTVFNSDLGAGGAGLTMNASGGATVDFGAGQRLAALNVTGSSVRMATADGATLMTGGLTLDAASRLDLNTSHLVVDYAPAAPGPLAQVAGWIRAGYNGGTWDGSGISSSAAAADAATLTAVGVLDNSDPLVGGRTDFEGIPVDASSVLVKYTYWGDANFDGKVTFDDYDIIDYYYWFPLPAAQMGWWTGDFDYDGNVDFDDYDKIDYAYWFQGAPLAGGLKLAGVVAPEPATLALLALGGLATLLRRRRA